jgi:DnaJ-class molecular chaperone
MEVNPGDQAALGTGEDVCPSCHGSGRVGSEPCRKCGGSGRVIEGIGGG